MPWPTVPVVTTGMDADTDTLPRTDILDHAQKFNQLIAMRAVADGVCDLDSSALIPSARLPAVYQPLDAQLTTLAGITAQQATDLSAVSTFIGTLLNDADAGTAQTTLGISTFVKTILDDATGDDVFTTLGAAKSLSANGYQKLPGGLIVQWGTFISSATPGTLTTITFPIAFASVCYGAFVIPVYGTTSPATSWLYNDPVATGANFCCSVASLTQYWFAIGK